MKRDVLLITPDFPPMTGGVANYLDGLARHFSDRIDVVAAEHPDWQTTDPGAPYPVYRMPLLFRWVWPRWLKTAWYLRSVASSYKTVITSHVLPIGSACLLAKKLTGLSYVVIVHGMDIRLARSSFRKRRLAQRVLKGAKVVVANSQALAREIVEVFGIEEVLVMYPCVGVEQNEGGQKSVVELRSDEVVEDDESAVFNVLTISRLVERKGHVRVLNALVQLRREGTLDSVRYTIAGDGPLRSSLESLVHDLGLDDVVRFVGRVSDEEKNQLFLTSDVFVMPVVNDAVDKEGFGLVYLEAALHGVPSIATRMSGVDEAVEDGRTGVLVEDGDVSSLARVIALLRDDVALREQLGRQAQERVQQTFTCLNQYSQLEPFL